MIKKDSKIIQKITKSKKKKKTTNYKTSIKKKKYFQTTYFNLCLLFLLLFLFSSCSSFLSKSTKVDSVDRTGSGLKIVLTVDTTMLQSMRKINYVLTLSNSGVDKIKLTKDNFKLLTDQTTIDGSSVLTKESVDAFYSEIFKDWDGILYHDDKRKGIKGSFFVDPTFFKDRTKKKFNIILNANYDYTTKFSNNIDINLDENNFFNVLDDESQAAPINMNKIVLEPYQDNIYTVTYYFTDKGKDTLSSSMGGLIDSFDTSTNIKKENIKIKFRNQDLSLNDCFIMKENSDDSVEKMNELVLNSNAKKSYIVCQVDLSDFKNGVKTTITTSGSFSYNYKITNVNLITLPEKRENNYNFN